MIAVKHRGEEVYGKVRRIGAVSRESPHSLRAWAMLTLDVNGECVYTVAREDELASF